MERLKLEAAIDPRALHAPVAKLPCLRAGTAQLIASRPGQGSFQTKARAPFEHVHTAYGHPRRKAATGGSAWLLFAVLGTCARASLTH